jgi:hypothetical protein
MDSKLYRFFLQEALGQPERGDLPGSLEELRLTKDAYRRATSCTEDNFLIVVSTNSARPLWSSLSFNKVLQEKSLS